MAIFLWYYFIIGIIITILTILVDFDYNEYRLERKKSGFIPFWGPYFIWAIVLPIVLWPITLVYLLAEALPKWFREKDWKKYDATLNILDNWLWKWKDNE